jgi:hypothetical protein
MNTDWKGLGRVLTIGFSLRGEFFLLSTLGPLALSICEICVISGPGEPTSFPEAHDDFRVSGGKTFQR